MGKAFNVANEYVSNWTLMKIEGLKVGYNETDNLGQQNSQEGLINRTISLLK